MTACWKGICDSEDRVRKSESRYFHHRFTRSNIFKYYEIAMRLVSPQMRESVARNYILSLIWRCYGPKRDILDYWGTLKYFVYDLIISYQRINVYRVETMNIGILFSTNDVSGKCNPINYGSIKCMV